MSKKSCRKTSSGYSQDDGYMTLVEDSPGSSGKSQNIRSRCLSDRGIREFEKNMYNNFITIL